MQESVFMQTFLTSQVHLAVKRTGNQKLGNYKVGVICLDIIPNSHDLWSCSWLWRGLREGFVGALGENILFLVDSMSLQK